MFKNYLVISYRNLRKNIGINLINIFGLAVGISCCLLIILYVADELSYDRHWKNAKNIYRVTTQGVIGNQETKTVRTPSPLSENLVREYPEILNATRMEHTPNMLVRYEDIVFNETHFMWVDTNFFDIFPMEVIFGDPKTALAEDHTVVMTLDNAKRFFGNPIDALNKVVNFEDGTPYRVSAVIANPTKNSHFTYGMLCPLSSWDWSWGTHWMYNFMCTYIQLHENADPEALEAKFPQFLRKYLAPHFQEASGMSFDEMEQIGGRYDYILQSLTDIHLYSHLDGELEPNSDIKYVYIFSIIAVFILFIACINFMNLATSRSAKRSREVGIRKVLGSTKNRLVAQFLVESILICILAAILSMLISKLFLPLFNQIAGKSLGLNYFSSWYLLPGILIFAIIIGIFAGTYPAFFLSSFQPVVVLKENLSSGLKGRTLRSILVVFQFTISIVLFISTLILFQQMNYIKNKRLGFIKENIVVIKRGWAIGQNPDGSIIDTGDDPAIFELFKNDLKQNPQILSVCGTINLPGDNFQNATLIARGAASQEQHLINYSHVDWDFAETFGLEIAEGRFFDRQFDNRRGLILNETAVKAFDLKEPYTEQLLGVPGDTSVAISILGIVKDFHYESLHKPIQPLVLDFEQFRRTYICVRIRPENVAETIAYIKKTWNDYIPYKPFEYYFFDENYDRLYQAEIQTNRLFTIFSVLSIIIASLGLFALVSFTTERRIREIGIRKTMGATVTNIVILILKEFSQLVLAANIIAWPIAYYLMHRTLQNYAYRISMNVITFIAAGFAALMIALLTVSYHSLKAAFSNPSETLKYE